LKIWRTYVFWTSHLNLEWFGAQIAFKLVAEHEALFECAIIVSPWLMKEEPMISKIMEMNKKQLKQLWNCFANIY